MRELIGIPYLNRGTSPAGVDCWGLVVLFHRMVMQSEVPRYDETYSDADNVGDAITAGWVDWEPVALGQERKGDVLAFRDPRGAEVIHCGVVIAPGKFLHCLSGRNSCVESYDKGMWKQLLVRIGRWNS
jgi:cell wall-associated NlpC family hydrolase